MKDYFEERHDILFLYLFFYFLETSNSRVLQFSVQNEGTLSRNNDFTFHFFVEKKKKQKTRKKTKTMELWYCISSNEEVITREKKKLKNHGIYNLLYKKKTERKEKKNKKIQGWTSM